MDGLSAAPTSLYRFFDADDQLLYVGITKRGRGRWDQHAKDKSWWHLVVRCEVEHYPDRPAAEAAEKAAIQAEHPRFNVVHNGSDQRVPSVPIICCRCRSPIADGEGYIEVSQAAVRDFKAGRRTDVVGWNAWHRRCDPDPEGPQYWIAVERIRTDEQLDRWDAHLGEKGWVEDCTNWFWVYEGGRFGSEIDPGAYFADLLPTVQSAVPPLPGTTRSYRGFHR